jgi:hypothetical protein
MVDASHADDGGVEFIDETQSGSVRLRSALQTDGEYLSNLGAWSDLSMEVPNDATAARIISVWTSTEAFYFATGVLNAALGLLHD